jgi:hypothetical protein
MNRQRNAYVASGDVQAVSVDGDSIVRAVRQNSPYHKTPETDAFVQPLEKWLAEERQPGDTLNLKSQRFSVTVTYKDLNSKN